MLSQRYFTDRAPQYLWMPMETLTARLLERDFGRKPRSPVSCCSDGSCARRCCGLWTAFPAAGRETPAARTFSGARPPHGTVSPAAAGERGRGADGSKLAGRGCDRPSHAAGADGGLRDGSLLPGLFLCFLETHFLRDFTVFGGFYQPTYLAEMRRGLVRALRETGGYEEEAAIIEAKRSAMTLGLIYLLRSRESGRFPVSTAELLEEPVSTPEVETSLQGVRRGGAGASELNAQAGSSLVMGASGLCL